MIVKEYVISLAVDGEEWTPGFFGWLLHVEFKSGPDDEEPLLIPYTENSRFELFADVLHFPRVDDAISALRDSDESARVRVVW